MTENQSKVGVGGGTRWWDSDKASQGKLLLGCFRREVTPSQALEGRNWFQAKGLERVEAEACPDQATLWFKVGAWGSRPCVHLLGLAGAREEPDLCPKSWSYEEHMRTLWLFNSNQVTMMAAVILWFIRRNTDLIFSLFLTQSSWNYWNFLSDKSSKGIFCYVNEVIWGLTWGWGQLVTEPTMRLEG